MRGKNAVEMEFMLAPWPKTEVSLCEDVKLEISFKQLLGYAKFSVINIFLWTYQSNSFENLQVVVI